MIRKTHRAVFKTGGDGLADGQFEAFVSVFGNVDSYGDRMMPGSFRRTLDEWAAKGDPIPVIWSHKWSDPNAHIGTVIEAAERDVDGKTGLWVRAQLDMDDDDATARKVHRLLKGRRVTQFSFAYDEVVARLNDDDVNEVFDVDLYEVGPTLLGANQATELLAAKTLDEIVAATKVALLRDLPSLTAGPAPEPSTDEEPDGAKSEGHAGDPVDASIREHRRAAARAELALIAQEAS